jgi:hypothetical protein
MKLVRSRPRRALLAAACVLTALALPASASALTFHIVNESGKPASEVFVNITAGGEFDVPGFTKNVPVALSSIPNGEVTVSKLISGRVYIEYGRPLREPEEELVLQPEETIDFHSSTRFDWAELTVHEAGTEAAKSDVANLTAVDQFGIGMRLTTFGQSGGELESVGSTYSDTAFAALQKIPGGPESTIRNAGGEIVRVLAPNQSSAYPLLTQYVESMAGHEITLHTAFFHSPFETSEYHGIFGSDGSIELTGTITRANSPNPPITEAGPAINIDGSELIEHIYTDPAVPNTLEGAIHRDLLAGFSGGFWGGRYGNDAINFCATPAYSQLTETTYCERFDQPGFAAARATPEPYPTYEQYAATIAEIGNLYGNPFSDASGKVTVALSPAKTLQLTILPDSPPAMSGGGGSSAANPAPAGPPAPKALVTTPPASRVTFKLTKTARFKHGKLMIGKLICDGACGKVAALLRPAHGKGVIARLATTVHKKSDTLVLKPTKAGKRLIAAGKAKRSKLTITVTQPGHSPSTKQSALRITG